MSAEQPLAEIVRRYDRTAPFYGALEPVFLLRRSFRARAVDALGLAPGERALEVGCGTGLNLRYLADAVGPRGEVLGVDASPGMLARARMRVARRGWRNVRLLQQDAASMEIDAPLDAVLFGLSYSVIPERRSALERAWGSLREGGRLVIFDGTLPADALGRVLRPITGLLLRITPGDPDARPWEDLVELGRPVERRSFWPGIWYTCAVSKTRASEGASV